MFPIVTLSVIPLSSLLVALASFLSSDKLPILIEIPLIMGVRAEPLTLWTFTVLLRVLDMSTNGLSLLLGRLLVVIGVVIVIVVATTAAATAILSTTAASFITTATAVSFRACSFSLLSSFSLASLRPFSLLLVLRSLCLRSSGLVWIIMRKPTSFAKPASASIAVSVAGSSSSISTFTASFLVLGFSFSFATISLLTSLLIQLWGLRLPWWRLVHPSCSSRTEDP